MAWTVDQAYDLGVQESQVPYWTGSPAEILARLEQLNAYAAGLHDYETSIWLSDRAQYDALNNAEIAGVLGGPRPPSPPTPPPQPPPKDDDPCPIAQVNLQMATDRYLANKAKFDQASQNKSIEALNAQHDTVDRLSAELDNLNTESTAQLAKDLAFVTGDTLKWLFGGYLPEVATALYNGFAIGRDGTILLDDVQKANSEGLEIGMSTVVDGIQLAASIVGATLVNEETEYVGSAIDIYNVLIDGSQIPGHLTEITSKADVVAKELIDAQNKLDDILFFQNNRAEWEKSLSDDYDAVNQKIADVYGQCVTQINFPNATTTPATASIDSSTMMQTTPAIAQPTITLAPLGVIEMKDPRVGTVLFGTAAKDMITKTTGNNGIFAGDGDDVVTLAGSYNVVFGGRGNDTIILGPGTTNVVAFSGKFADYKLAFIQGSLAVTDTVANRDGSDGIKGATHLQFLDGEYKIDFSIPDITRALTKMGGPNVVAAPPSAVILDPTMMVAPSP